MDIYLSFKITESNQTDNNLTRTSNGWFYGETYSKTYDGPYISIDKLLLNYDDIACLRQIIVENTPRNYENHDWVSYKGDDFINVKYSGFDICKKINDFIGDRYPFVFIPCEECQPYNIHYILSQSILPQTKEFLDNKSRLAAEYEAKQKELLTSYQNSLVDYYKKEISQLAKNGLIWLWDKLPETKMWPLDIAFNNQDTQLIEILFQKVCLR